MKAFLPTAFAFVSFFGAGYASGQEAEARATPVVSAPIAKVPKLNPLTVSVELLGGQKISGALTDVPEIPFRAALGEVKVPVTEVAGVRFASAEDTSTTIILKNGDSITGATDIKTVTVDTEWGTAKINGSSISSILFLPDLKWTSSMQLQGKRWSLVDAKSAGPGMVPNSGGTIPSGASPIGSNSTSRPVTNPR